MMNEDSKKRLKAIAEAVAKLMKEQDEQKARETAEAEDDDMDLAADMLMEAANLIEDAADLLVQVSFLLRDKDIELMNSWKLPEPVFRRSFLIRR